MLWFLGSSRTLLLRFNLFYKLYEKKRIKVYYPQVLIFEDKEIYSLVQSKCTCRDMDGM